MEIIEYCDKDGLRNGFCIQKWKDGRLLEGYYLRNRINGWAIINKPEINIVGEFSEDIINGYAEVFYKSENKRIKSYWNNGNLDDIGIEYGSDYFYEGNFKNGEKDGYGKQVWNDNEIYEGEWKCAKYDGYGIYYYSNGKKYIGEWRNSMKNGFGKLIWPNGKIYVGFFKDDQIHGFGIYYLFKDCYIINFWKNGKRHGLGKYIKENNIYYGNWEESKLIENMNLLEFMDSFNDENKNYLFMFQWSIKEINQFIFFDE